MMKSASVVCGCVSAGTSFIYTIYLLLENLQECQRWSAEERYAPINVQMFFCFLNICFFGWNVLLLTMSKRRRRSFVTNSAYSVPPLVILTLLNIGLIGIPNVIKCPGLKVFTSERALIAAEISFFSHLLTFCILLCYMQTEYLP